MTFRVDGVAPGSPDTFGLDGLSIEREVWRDIFGDVVKVHDSYDVGDTFIGGVSYLAPRECDHSVEHYTPEGAGVFYSLKVIDPERGTWQWGKTDREGFVGMLSEALGL